jgi:hypothetical protein
MRNGEMILSQRQQPKRVEEAVSSEKQINRTPLKRRFKSLDNSYMDNQRKLPTHLPNLISIAAKKYRE